MILYEYYVDELDFPKGDRQRILVKAVGGSADRNFSHFPEGVAEEALSDLGEFGRNITDKEL